MLVLIAAFPVFAVDEARFPRPEFTKGYLFPEQTLPHAPTAFNPLFSLCVLAVVLLATVYLLYYRRSRYWIKILGLFSFGYFGEPATKLVIEK